MKSKKLFTVLEANSLLPELSLILERIKTLKKEIDSQYTSTLPNVEKASHNGGHEKGVDYLLKLNGFNSGIISITDMGCLLKDIDLGLIDFPSIREGREVYLCWKLGEEKIMFWHELDMGFDGRKPV